MTTVAKKPRLLLIEDHPDTRAIYKDVFEREGFQVLIAEDGEKGLSYAQSTLPDVILLDLMLPKLSGFDVLTRLRAQPDTQGIPVMIFSAMADAADRKRAAELGVTEYSLKTLNPPKTVVNRVRGLLARLDHSASSSTSAESFRVALKDASFDGFRLQSHVGLSETFRCPKCHAELALEMLADPTRGPGHWFAAHLLCSGCQQTL